MSFFTEWSKEQQFMDFFLEIYLNFHPQAVFFYINIKNDTSCNEKQHIKTQLGKNSSKEYILQDNKYYKLNQSHYLFILLQV